MQAHTSTQVFRYEVAHGASEYHAMLHVTNPYLPFAEQLASLHAAYEHLVGEELPGAVPVLKRYFLSDAANQADMLQATLKGHPACALSIVEQPPLDGTKVALWVYLQTDVQPRLLPEGDCEVRHGGYRHLWSASNSNKAPQSEGQTRQLLNDYAARLKAQDCTLADNCLRTWFFVQNVDVNYSGVVKARNDVFLTHGLTKNTHFIASTGIAGRHAHPEVLVQMDAYAVDGLAPGQVRHLYAPTHLNPTYEYGVSFERGTYIDYGDRRHVFISGTASINNRGEVMHPGDIRRQAERMCENVEVLLAEAACTFKHVGHLIIYLRDIADYAVVQALFEERFPRIPKVYLQAPVCRPGWLIEMECMAVKSLCNEAYKPY